jgi:cytochrome c oxidase subunit 3
MSNLVRHPYHLVDESPWPLLRGVSSFFLTLGLVKWFHFHELDLLILGLILVLLCISQWWLDVSFEGTAIGFHSKVVELGLRWGMILFIVSEIFFFISFFWAFFHRSLVPVIELGGHWPPLGIVPFNPFEVPLLNTLILISSGITVTWSHHALIKGNFSNFKTSLGITVILGVYFTFFQALEYYEARFRMSDSVFGSVFFIATGFHGLHVIVGTTFLLICLVRGLLGQFRKLHHFGFEAAAWYWHFVDVVWLFLFIVVYWWGGSA